MHLLTGQALVHGLLFSVTPGSQETLPPSVHISLEVSLGATPPQVPVPEGPIDQAPESDPVTYIPLTPDLATMLRQLDASPEEFPGSSGLAHIEIQSEVDPQDDMVVSLEQNPQLEVDHEGVMSLPTLTLERPVLHSGHLPSQLV